MDIESPSTPRRQVPRPSRSTIGGHEAQSPSNQLSDVFPTLAPPQPLHTRASNESWNPLPSVEWNTPSSSPTKGSGRVSHLTELFDSAIQLTPTSPQSKGSTTPTKKPLRSIEETGSGDVAASSGEETPKRYNKENAPPVLKAPPALPGRSYAAGPSVAARSYRSSGRKKYDPTRDMTFLELEKLAKPQVKRLRDVAQLYFYDYYYNLVTYVHERHRRTDEFKDDNQDLPDDDYKVAWKRYAGRERVALRKRRTRLHKGDFQLLTQVGQGGYGQVYLAEHRSTKEVCALKVMSKKLLFKLDEIRHVLTERDILTAAKSEWLVKLLYAFQDDESIYLAMEYVPGGDFRTLLNNTGVLHFSHARFYIAEMFCCVNALHELGYIHRDLKPENFLIDSSGHVKLTDFGLSAGHLAPDRMESMRLRLDMVKDMDIPMRSTLERRKAYRTLRESDVNYAKSIVGSPDYMAPEVLRGEEYDFSVDYWSLGCMLYEALAGYPPFAGATVDETWHNLKKWKSVLHKPEYENPNYYLSRRTWDFITRLVTDLDRRFPDFKSVQEHAYFQGEVDWDNLRVREPPFVPELDSETDAGYFDDFSNEADMAKYKEVHDKQQALEAMAERDGNLNKAAFLGFTFKHRKTTLEDIRQQYADQEDDDQEYGTMF